MKIYPILNNLGKGKYAFIFILNERAVKPGCAFLAFRGKFINFAPNFDLRGCLKMLVNAEPEDL